MKRLLILSLHVVFMMNISCCKNGSDAERIDSFYDDFTSYDSSIWYKSEPSPYIIFYCTLRPEQVNYISDGTLSVMTLTLDDDLEHDDTPDLPYKSGELRTTSTYGYGLYEIRMKPVIHTGVVSSFFVMTGPWDGPGVPHDEVDLEFILDPDDGNPNPVMQCNYFTDGVGNHEYIVDLAFNATNEYHTYAFRWEPNRITWFIDGVEVHSATENIPAYEGRIMMNLYPPDPDWELTEEWTGYYDGTVPLVAYYDWVRYTPLP